MQRDVVRYPNHLGPTGFNFYGALPDGFDAAVRGALGSFEGYMFEIGKEQDPGWLQFLNVLYPSPEQMQGIMNLRVLALLEGDRDVHSLARTVDHFLYFTTDAGRSLFCDEVVKDGFEVEKQMQSEGEISFGVHLNRLQSVEQGTIDAMVLKLLRLAKRFGGEYDGWGCTASSE